jgi:hypothetical protein
MMMQMGGTFFAVAWDAAVLDISPTKREVCLELEYDFEGPPLRDESLLYVRFQVCRRTGCHH